MIIIIEVLDFFLSFQFSKFSVTMELSSPAKKVLRMSQ